RIRHVDVSAPETFANEVGDLGVMRRIGDIAPDRGSGRADGTDRIIERALTPPGDQHLRCLCGKERGAREPDAAVAAGDHGDLSLQSCHNPPLLLETRVDLAFLSRKISVDNVTSFFPKTIV